MKIRRTLILILTTSVCLALLGACKSNQTQQQSAGMPGSSSSSSSSGSSGGSSSPSTPSNPSPSGRSGGSPSTGGTVSTGGGLPGSPGLPGGGLPGSGSPGSGQPGSGSPGSPGTTSDNGSGDGGDGGRPGTPGEETPDQAQAGADADGDGVPDTAQSGAKSENVDFSESTASASASREEQVATLDQELEGSMRDYDGRILEERSGVMGRANQSGAEDQLEDFDRSVAYYDEAEGSADSNEPTDKAAPPPAQGTNEPGLPTSDRSKDVVTPPPDDIPSGNDDDVVARQIREAAMKEQDPDLREALWEEYRKYKNQTKH